MKVRLHIDALSIEADWPRAGRADFAEALRAALEGELTRAARRGAFGPARVEPHRRPSIPALALSLRCDACSCVARAVAGEIAPPAAPGQGKTR
jgi:hypothetical protein